jgi:hypothetical protein
MKERMYIEAPQYSVEIDRLPVSENIFLAGSITGAEDWQKELAYASLRDYPRIIDLFNVFNPRRANYNALDPALELEQITWEYHCIHKKCEHILFWFAPETLAPITLFELGSALHTHDHGKIYIGIDPEYKRKNDVIIQTQLRNKTLAKRIVFSKQDLLEQIIKINS